MCLANEGFLAAAPAKWILGTCGALQQEEVGWAGRFWTQLVGHSPSWE